MQETWVPSLGREDPLEKEMVTHSSIPVEFRGQRSLAGYSLWGLKKSDTTEWLTWNILNDVRHGIMLQFDRDYAVADISHWFCLNFLSEPFDQLWIHLKIRTYELTSTI